MKTILKYIKPYNTYILFTLFLKFGASMMDLLIPSLLAKIIDDIVPLGEVRQIFLWGGVMILCAVISVTTNVRANRMAEISAGGMTRQLRHDLFEKITYLSARQMNEFTVSSAVSRLTSDTYNVNRMMARMQRLGVRGPILLAGGILITVTMEPKLASVLIASLPFIIVIVWIVTKLSIPVYTGQQRVLDGLVRVLQENITGVRVIRALSRTDYERERYDGVNEELARIEQKAGRISSASGPATTLVLNLGLTAVIITGAYLVQKGETGPGAIIAFLSYFILILNAMLGITRIFVMCSKGMASLGRISEVLEAPEEMQVQIRSEESDKAIAGVSEESIPLVEFRDVSFSYNGKGDHLSHISFTLKKGESLGIIGATGSGKSTIVNLLLRFYDVDSGSIQVEHLDIRKATRKSLRESYGMVLQETWLKAGTIRENLIMGKPEATEEEIKEAAKAAHAHSFIKRLPKGYDTVIGEEGGSLSAGQKQLLCIARVMLCLPPMLILDEATSSIDTRTEMKIQNAFAKMMQGRTSFIVAHRLSTIQEADIILVMKDGHILEQGSHEELLKKKGFYSELYNSQFAV